MKLVLDIPSAGVGLLTGLLLSSTSFGAVWLLNYDGVPVAGALASAALLAGAAAWLAFLPGQVPSVTLRANHFSRVDRPPTVLPHDLQEHPAVALAGRKPLEWITPHLFRKGPYGHDVDGGNWRAVASGLLAAQLADGEGRRDIVRAVSAAVRSMHFAGHPQAQSEKLARMAWDALRTGGRPDFVAFADAAEQAVDGRAPSGAPRHAFPATQLLADIEAARLVRYSVPAMSFQWLKAFDRPLFYAVNNLGRSAGFVEGAGISAHFAAEKSAGRGIAVPQVADALARVEDYFKSQDLLDGLDGPEPELA